MSKRNLLREFDAIHIKEILSDRTLLASILMDGEVAREITVKMDGTIIIGRTKWKWVNILFSDRRKIPFVDFAFKVSNALAGQVKNRNETIFDGITDAIKNMYREGHPRENDIWYVTDGLYDTMRLGWNGPSRSTYLVTDSDSQQGKQRSRQQTNVVSHGRIKLNSGETYGPVITIERVL